MKQAIIICLLAVVALAGGCSKEPASSEPSTAQLSAPDPGLRQQLTDQIQSVLPEAVTSAPWSNSAWPPNPDMDVYSVTVVWGTLAGPAVTPTPTNWSGTLQVVASGEVKVAAVISFDPGQDSVLTTNNPLRAAWKSFTQADVDGLHFLIFIDRNSPLTVIPQMTITTAPVSLTRGFSQLDRFDTLIFADNMNAMLIVSRKLPRNPCPSGAIAGLWTKENNSGQSGTFDGKWMGRANTQTGYMNGSFWTDSTGGRYFFGQYTDMAHTTLGYLKGKWWYDDPRMCPTCGSGHGFFSGEFTNLDTTSVGELVAEIGDFTSPTVGQLQMSYRGVWKIWCPKPELNTSNVLDQ